MRVYNIRSRRGAVETRAGRETVRKRPAYNDAKDRIPGLAAAARVSPVPNQRM